MWAVLMIGVLAAAPGEGKAAAARVVIPGALKQALATGGARLGWYEVTTREVDEDACADPKVSLIISAGRVRHTLPVKKESCAGLFTALRAEMPAARVGEAELTLGRIRVGERVLHDEVDHCRRTAENLECRTDSEERSITLLSVVGSIVSYRIQWSGAMGGGPPYHSTNVVAIDGRSGKAADVLSLVEPASLEQALRADSALKEEAPEVLEAKDAAGILARIAERSGAGEPGKEAPPVPFSVHAYDAKKGLVAIRLAPHLVPPGGMAPNEPTVLGLWVKPRAGFVPALQKAASGDGLLGAEKKRPDVGL